MCDMEDLSDSDDDEIGILAAATAMMCAFEYSYMNNSTTVSSPSTTQRQQHSSSQAQRVKSGPNNLRSHPVVSKALQSRSTKIETVERVCVESDPVRCPRVFLQKSSDRNILVLVTEELYVLRDGKYVPFFSVLDPPCAENESNNTNVNNAESFDDPQSPEISDTKPANDGHVTSLSIEHSDSLPQENAVEDRVNSDDPPSNNICQHCSESFETIELLIDHLTDSHAHTPTFKDDYETLQKQSLDKKYNNLRSGLCAISKPLNRVRRRMTRLNVKEGNCYLCGIIYSNKSLYTTHMNSVHLIDEKYLCVKCSYVAGAPEHIQIHFLRTHGSNYATKMRHMCEICGKTLSSLGHLGNHIRAHKGEKPFVCNDCGRTFSSKQVFLYHQTIHRPRNVPCDVCGKLFPNDHQLRSHKRTHSDHRRYQCTFCGNGFKFQNSLKVHILCVHSNVRPYECTDCGRRFALLNDLNTHRKKHSRIKSFVCEKCGKAFANNPHLRIHMRIHTGEKPYFCYICSRRFSQMTGLKYHSKTHGEDYDFEHHKRIYHRRTAPKPVLMTDACSSSLLNNDVSYLSV